MINEHALGRIVDIDEGGVATIKATLPNLYHAIDRKYNDVEIILPDGRRISPEQRRKCYALLGEIAEFVDGYRNAETLADAKQMMKWDFVLKRMEEQERRLFSLANCDMSTAREFITYLIEFIIKNDIPTKIPLIDQAEDVGRYIYACMVNKKCCVCGKPADLHHVQSVGSQGYRDKINHIGMDALPLCREHHTESHSKGQMDFIKCYHLQPIKIDKKIAKIYKLNTKETKSNE
jgi:hypothetical protein